MNVKRLLFVCTAAVLASLVAVPASNASSDAMACATPVVDNVHGGVFDHAAVANTVQAIQHAHPDIEIYVRGVTPLVGDNTPSVFDEQFRAICNPATDYMLVVLDNRGLAGVFYGSHFDRLTPVLNTYTGMFLTDFYASDDPDKTLAVTRLLGNFRATLAQNPNFADYVMYPTGYTANGPVPSSDSSRDTLAERAGFLIGFVVVSLLVVVIGVVAIIRDKRDHRQG